MPASTRTACVPPKGVQRRPCRPGKTQYKRTPGTRYGAGRPLTCSTSCGTAPLLVAASRALKRNQPRLVGIDIAFRWLVVAQKRLAEAGLDVPLLCACAEALPFPDGSFDCAAAESVLETVRDQRASAKEIYRVLKPGGSLFVSTPNRFSPGLSTYRYLGRCAASGPRACCDCASAGRYPAATPASVSLVAAAPDFRSRLFEIADSGPASSPQQVHGFGLLMQPLISAYNLARRLPLGRDMLKWVGPLLQVTASKAPVRSGE